MQNETLSTPIATEPTNEPKSTPKPYTYKVCARIHEKMPEYRFVASGEDIFVKGLDVYNENDTAILSVSNEAESCPIGDGGVFTQILLAEIAGIVTAVLQISSIFKARKHT